MPKSLVEVRRPYEPEEEIGILGAVHSALVAAFRIPQEDEGVRLVVHEPHRFTTAPDLEQPDRYTIITIECFAGRSIEAKRRLYRELGERLEAFGIPADHLTVILHEISLDNWGAFGGRPASDVDLGFAIDV